MSLKYGGYRYALLVSLLIVTAFHCSPTGLQGEQLIPWCHVANSVWYIEGTRNNLCEFMFYTDSVIIYEYYYSPTDQQLGSRSFPQYTVMSIERRKLEVLDKNIPYKDGDNQWLYLQDVRAYQTTLEGVKIFDFSNYIHVFVAVLTNDMCGFGMYDEFAEVQVYWELKSCPEIELDFSIYKGWYLERKLCEE